MPLLTFSPTLDLQLFPRDLQVLLLLMLLLETLKLLSAPSKWLTLLILISLLGTWSVTLGLLLFKIRMPLGGLNVHICFGSEKEIRILSSFITLFVFALITTLFLKFRNQMVSLLLMTLILSVDLLVFILICGMITLTVLLLISLALFLMTSQLFLILIALFLLEKSLVTRFMLLFKIFLLVSPLVLMVLMQNSTTFYG